MELKVDQQVTWESQAGGTWKTKTGTVLAIVPARHRIPSGIIPDGTPKSRIKFDGCVSFVDRVIVAVPRPGGRVVDYYAPRPAIVKPI